MNIGILLIAAATAFTSNHPEEALPDAPPMVSPGPYSEFIMHVQQKLHQAGFNAGPVNGDLGPKTQAALAQYQISQNIPASGSLDDETLRALDMKRPEVQ
jgi:peptidoglycan hydrolase-like protein with peptidoglycan-binding domain